MLLYRTFIFKARNLYTAFELLQSSIISLCLHFFFWPSSILYISFLLEIRVRYIKYIFKLLFKLKNEEQQQNKANITVRKKNWFKIEENNKKENQIKWMKDKEEKNVDIRCNRYIRDTELSFFFKATTPYKYCFLFMFMTTNKTFTKFQRKIL